MTAPMWDRVSINDSPPSEIIAATLLRVLELNPCPDCHMSTGYGSLHGLSQVWPGDVCHIGYWLEKFGNSAPAGEG